MGSHVIGLWTSSFRGNTVSNSFSTYTADKVIYGTTNLGFLVENRNILDVMGDF